MTAETLEIRSNRIAALPCSVVALEPAGNRQTGRPTHRQAHVSKI